MNALIIWWLLITWCVLSVMVALVIGKAVRERDR